MKLREGVRDGSGMVRSRIFLSKCKRQGGSVGEGSGGGVSVCKGGVCLVNTDETESIYPLSCSAHIDCRGH